MTAHAGRLSRGLAPGVVLGAIALLAASAVSGHGIKLVAPIVIGVVTLAAWHRELLQWRSLVGLILLVVLFVPIGRYALPGNLPFNLELYRLVVALVVVVWLASLLIDPRVRLRRTYFDGAATLLLVACVVASDSPTRAGSTSSATASRRASPSFSASSSSTTWWRRLFGDASPSCLCSSCSGSAAWSSDCARSSSSAPATTRSTTSTRSCRSSSAPARSGEILRGGNLRVFGPAQHPIALGAVLIMILPIAVYFARIGQAPLVVGAVVICSERWRPAHGRPS